MSVMSGPGARPSNAIPIELEIQPKFPELWFEMYSAKFYYDRSIIF